MSAKLRVATAVICDEVRIENNGKFFLIGVYPLRVIAVPALPDSVVISCYMEVESNFRQIEKGRCRIVNPSEESVYEDEINANFGESGSNFMFFHGMQFAVTEFGPYRLQWQFGEGDWSEIAKIELTKTNTPPSRSLTPN